MPAIFNEKQISLFDLLFENEEETAIKKTELAPKKKNGSKKTVKPEVPDILIRMSQCKTLEDILRFLPDQGAATGTDQVCIKYSGYRYTSTYNRYDLRVIGNDIIRVDDVPSYKMEYYNWGRNGDQTECNFVYFDKGGKCWNLPMKLVWDSCFHPYSTSSSINHVEIEMGKPTWIKKVLYLNNIKLLYGTFFLNQGELEKILSEVNPYGYDFAKKYYSNPDPCDCALMLMAPQLEQLYKAGYCISDKIMKTGKATEQSVIDAFNRLTQPGKNMKEIFKCSKTLYTAMRDVDDIARWDVFRKMEKQGKFNRDTLIQAIDANYSEKDLDWINRILNKKTYEDKQVFTWDTLQNYLGRLNNFQALKGIEAFQILADYLDMCKQLGINPRIDSDSLKREHDVAARTLREKRDEIMAAKMIGACDYLKVNDYEEDVYFIRGIRDYDDLIDEAEQQGNCIVGYASQIIDQKALIYVMRRKSNPDRSLITVEIDPKMSHIRQKLLAYNKDIYNRSQTEFLDRWIAKVRQRKKMGALHIDSTNTHTESVLS